ncbi:MAG: UDP-3-O-(3-hydroxymyristoyl)glucosamine N-acyltransferase [Prevotellaceae bacterium]|nr:UDP-3-O-(3-hydroxymyristoyl)glucosamine N-acyltransferase [Prevotellaceae bacterium]
MEFTAQQIAEFVGGSVDGDPAASARTFARIEEGEPGALSFLANPKYTPYIYTTTASIVLVADDFVPERPVAATLVRCQNPYEATARLLTLYQRMTERRSGIHPRATVEESAVVGADCYIGPGAYIGKEAVIGPGTQIYANCVVEERATVGSDCIFYPNVSIYHDCKVGSRVILHSGVVVGADGFGFAPGESGYEKIPQIGIATIEDDVEIGANTCVDRSTMGSTFVRRGAKIDNLCQIAHNVDVGSHTVMSAQVGVAGSTKIGQWCMFGGQVGIAGHATVADRTHSGAQAGIAGSVRRSGTTLLGSPAIDAKQFARASVVFKFLPELQAEIRTLKEEIEKRKG